jgi:uncharacterized DUF497 family protein
MHLHYGIYVYTINGGYQQNVLVRGVPFDLAAEFAWEGALIVEDLRKDYGERRFQALGLIGDRLHMMVFTLRANRRMYQSAQGQQTRGETI